MIVLKTRVTHANATLKIVYRSEIMPVLFLAHAFSAVNAVSTVIKLEWRKAADPLWKL